ncbi:MAG: sugar phosphate nucleotidyltransferase [Chitinophagales bacterium]|jgi:mannose-1-phosphate guanylyltransferase|nr:sugar phosphate nucleotidyltransferase [Chitinophagales bacterium]
MKNNYLIILAGGLGTRFWPKSRSHYPKQFLDLTASGQTMIQLTHQRFQAIIPDENIYVVTSTEFMDICYEQLPQIPRENILGEPERKNTFASINLACFIIAQKSPDANVVIAPADHIIEGKEVFEEVVNHSLKYVSQHRGLVTIGLKPTRPSTGYGYIQFIPNDEKKFLKVKTFTEKPNEELAKQFIESGDFLWNSGMFIWNVNTYFEELKIHQKDAFELFDSLKAKFVQEYEKQKAISLAFSMSQNISIDYAILEKSDCVFVIPASYSWSDIGTWTSLYEILPKDYLGNAHSGGLLKVYNAQDNLIVAQNKKLIIIDGIKDIAVIDTDNALLILPIAKEQEVKNICIDLKNEKLDEFL